ncbi:TIGR01459 family HAD-type hydrolase [Nordella sp. HKS 07]|uniref:TIGR01459 family HAD-type hydrolase n=1 Tax=Nordella sp. HKS 07 TaxID=2712222 RepID=UPI0013E1BBA4|nr:TIGR01459 family HAD-type hydrolase [Nordella sp. HKS 07]QIG49138.1 TIGR01459 family HAD-type hydrolase [Nordella sp. HKS 07]
MKDLSARYPIWLCDIWGVVHNGVAHFPPAVEALKAHRGQGGFVTLLTNAPRSAAKVAGHLAQLGVTREHYDLIVTSGDVTHELMKPYDGHRIYYLGPDRDLGVLDDLRLERSSPEEAEVVLCVGLVHDDRETPDDYSALLERMARRNLPMVCANPDKVVRRGSRLIYCAGALAERYAALGGKVVMAGKPYRPIYDLALARVASERGVNDKRSFLAIGDGPETDIKGAADFGLDMVLIAGGISEEGIDPQKLEAEIRAIVPDAHIVRTLPFLSWP